MFEDAIISGARYKRMNAGSSAILEPTRPISESFALLTLSVRFCHTRSGVAAQKKHTKSPNSMKRAD